LAKSKKDPDLQKVALFALGGQVEQKSVVKLLTETLAEGSAVQQQAVLLGIAFFRNDSLAPLLEPLEASADALDPETKECLEVAQAVLAGEGLSGHAKRIQDLLGGTIERQRFFSNPG
ncbi:MAG: hypothetical protein ACPG31_13820, partial [Planctomycetota bacterium]